MLAVFSRITLSSATLGPPCQAMDELSSTEIQRAFSASLLGSS